MPFAKPAFVAHPTLVWTDVHAHSILDVHLDQRGAVVDLSKLDEQLHAEVPGGEQAARTVNELVLVIAVAREAARERRLLLTMLVHALDQ